MTHAEATDWIHVSVTVRHGMPHYRAPARVILRPIGEYRPGQTVPAGAGP